MSGAPPLAATVFRGVMMLFGLRFVLRAMGLVSVMITARLVTPEDYGVVGTVALVTGFFAILMATGAGEGLIRLREIETSHVETAWTIQVTACVVVAAGLWLVAPLAARELEEPRLVEALRVSCFVPVLGVLRSPGTMLFMREFQYRREFNVQVVQKVVAVSCTVAGALLLRDWRGLIWGGVAGAALFTLLSYALVPFRPRLHYRRLSDFLGFSAWSYVKSFASYVALTADEVVVRRIAATDVFGLYHTSRDLSRILVSEFVAPAAGALLPGLSRLQDEPARFARAASRAVGVGALVAVACGLGVSATAAEVTTLLLGSQWTAAAPFLALVAVGGIGQTLAGLHRGVLAALGRADLSAKLWMLRALVMVLGCGAAGLAGWGPLGVAWSFAVLSNALTLLDYAVIFSRLGRPRALLEVFGRPVLAGLGMVLALSLLPVGGLPLLASALAKVALGGAVYLGLVAGLWWAAGRPDGPETALLHRLPPVLSRPFLPRRAA